MRAFESARSASVCARAGVLVTYLVTVLPLELVSGRLKSIFGCLFAGCSEGLKAFAGSTALDLDLLFLCFFGKGSRTYSELILKVGS